MARSTPTNRPARAEAVRTPGFVGGVLLTAFAVALGFGLIVPALPAFATRLGATFGAASAVVATFAAVRLLFAGPAGALTDRIGARPVVVGGLLVVAASSAATAFATSYVELLLLRGAGGVGSAMFVTGIGHHIVRTIPSAERGRANGLMQGAFLLGGASGPAVGGLVVEAWGIRVPFLLYAATLLLATAATVAYLRDDRSGAGRVAAEAGGDPGDAAAVTAATGEGAEFPIRAASGQARLGPLLRDRTFRASLWVYMAVSWASQGTRFVAVPLLGAEVLGHGIGLVGVALTASSVAHAALLWPATRVADGRGRLLPLRVGTVVYVVSMVGLATVSGPAALVVWMVVQGAANGITSPIPAAVVGDLAPPDAAGRAVGVMNVARDVGAVLGPVTVGVLAEHAGFDAAFLVSAGLLAAGFAATLVMRETLQPAAAEVPAESCGCGRG